MNEEFARLQLKKFLTWSILFYWFFLIIFIFLNSKVSHLSSDIQDKKSQIQAIKNRESNISQLQNSYYQIANDIETVTQTLPDEENIAGFVKYLENLSEETSVDVEIRFDDKANAEINKNKYLVFDLAVSGPGNNVSNYWSKLEKGPYFVNINNFSFNSTDGLNSDVKLSFKAKVFTNDPYSTN